LEVSDAQSEVSLGALGGFLYGLFERGTRLVYSKTSAKVGPYGHIIKKCYVERAIRLSNLNSTILKHSSKS